MAWRARELLLVASSRNREAEIIASVDGADRWPVPPARLRVRVVTHADLEIFLRGGKAQAELIRDLVRRAGMDPNRLGAILDFGCGCGRLARWWPELHGTELHGCDLNPALVTWCTESLSFMRAVSNDLVPPLPHADESFDLVYALSVFTHLPGDLQQSWVSELRRVLKPEGLLFVTVSGDAYLDTLGPADRATFERDEMVVHFDELPGSNVCATYHPPAYVERRLLAGFELVESVHASADPAAAAKRHLPHDAYLARKTA